MSRFYEALREASRSPAKPDAESAEGAPKGFELVEGIASRIEAAVVKEQELSASPLQQTNREFSLESLHQDLLESAKAQFPSSAPRRDVAPQKNVAAPHQAVSASVKTQIRFDPNAHLITQSVDQAAVEHYRRLRTKILQQHADKPFKSLLIASPNPQEGKTVTVLNLGVSFAMVPDFKVLVVDGDLRRGTIGKLLGIDDHPGFSNLLDGTAQLNDVVLQCSDLPVHFMLRGNSKVAPAELLQSSHVDDVFRRMTEEFDLVLMDSPPVNLITDAQLLAGHCEAVLLVARAFSTTRKGLEQTARELNAFRVIGTVLNGSTRAQLYRRYSGYY
jgi:capsular exopolysaccharide synthesis family protein